METLSKEYRDYQRPCLWKRFDTTKLSKERFIELAKDPRAFGKTTVDEARAAKKAGKYRGRNMQKSRI